MYNELKNQITKTVLIKEEDDGNDKSDENVESCDLKRTPSELRWIVKRAWRVERGERIIKDIL